MSLVSPVRPSVSPSVPSLPLLPAPLAGTVRPDGSIAFTPEAMRELLWPLLVDDPEPSDDLDDDCQHDDDASADELLDLDSIRWALAGSEVQS